MIVGILLGLLFASLAVGWYGFERQRQAYDELVAALERDREEARHEAQVFRRLVLPIYDKAENSISGAAPSLPPNDTPRRAPESGARTSGESAAPSLSPLFNRRVPFRIRFKQMAAASNTKQKNTDALAAAIQSASKSTAQKPETSSHA